MGTTDDDEDFRKIQRKCSLTGSQRKSSYDGSQRKSSLADGSEAGTTIAGDDNTKADGEEEPAVEIVSFMEKAKFYTSLCLGSTAILAVFAFLFAIPFVVEPAISTILADFSPIPIACSTSSHVLAEGIKNCSWSSCREGKLILII